MTPDAKNQAKVCRDCGTLTQAADLARHECGTRRLCIQCARKRSASRRASLSDEQRAIERAAIRSHQQRYKANRTEEQMEKMRAYHRDRRAAETKEQRESRLRRRRELRSAAPEHKREIELAAARSRTAAWRSAASPEKRDMIRAYMRDYRRANPGGYKKRREVIRKATPEWDIELMSFVFGEAIHLAGLRREAFGFDWHVDHFVPLKGKSVCGLHVWSNLKVIPATLNMMKKNNFSDSLRERWWI